MQTAFRQQDGGQIADAVAFPLILVVGQITDRHPFAIDPARDPLARFIVAFVRLMVLCAMLPAVIGDFMIVPLRDHRPHLVQTLQIGIGTVALIAQAIVHERQDLIARPDRPARQSFCSGWVFANLIFVEIIAQMHDQVQIVARAGGGIGVEPAEGQVGTAEHAHTKFGGFSIGQRARASLRGGAAIRGNEAVIIPAAGLQPVDH